MARCRQTSDAARLAAAAILLAVVAGPGRAFARSPEEPGLEVVSSHLRTARTLAQRGVGLDRLAVADPLVRLRDGVPEIEVRFRSLDADTVGALAALGVAVDHVSYRYARVLAHADPALLPALAALPGVTAIHPDYGARSNAGAVPGQGDAAMHAAAARARFGVDGSGVRVGILSDSFDQVIGGTIHGSGCARALSGSSSQFSGDLPDDVIVLDDGPPHSIDEGAAMGEIVHDIAPGAALLFASAYPDEASFAEHIAALAACGADILVDDVLYFAEPMFQDGIVAQAAQAAVDGGAAYFSAVGNQGNAGIDQVYRDAVPGMDDEGSPPTGNDFHDFGAGSFAAVTVPAHCGVRLVLQWDEPFSGTLGAGATTDLDLYVLSAASPSATVLAGGTDTQGCATSDAGPSGDPLEIAAFQNRSAAARTVYVAVDHFCGRKDVRFRIVTFAEGCSSANPPAFDPEVFDAAQIYGHPAAAGVAAVAAVFYGEVDSGGAAVMPVEVIDVEPFSARGGPLPFAFDAAGHPLPGAPVTRDKPDFTAPDGVNTTFFGSDSADDHDSFPNFFGTSAAAPHAAAVAALLRQARPSLATGALVEALRRTALDIGPPAVDVLSGYGLIDAAAALAAVVTAPTATASPSPRPTPTVTQLLADCNGDGRVGIDDLVVAVRVALGEAAVGACAAADGNADGRVEIDELVRAVATALSG